MPSAPKDDSHLLVRSEVSVDSDGDFIIGDGARVEELFQEVPVGFFHFHKFWRELRGIRDASVEWHHLD